MRNKHVTFALAFTLLHELLNTWCGPALWTQLLRYVGWGDGRVSEGWLDQGPSPLTDTGPARVPRGNQLWTDPGNRQRRWLLGKLKASAAQDAFPGPSEEYDLALLLPTLGFWVSLLPWNLRDLQ